jgi:transposase
MRPTGSPEALERRRRRAIQLLKQNLPPVEVARRVGVDRRSVRRWKAAYLKQGERALRPKPAPGRPPKLSAADKSRLTAALLQGAKAAGFPTDLWTCPRVAQLIAKRFGVHYHVDHIGRLLRSLGFTPQKPARRALERDEEKIQRWVKEQWPRVKKKPRA